MSRSMKDVVGRHAPDKTMKTTKCNLFNNNLNFTSRFVDQNLLAGSITLYEGNRQAWTTEFF